MSYTIMMPVHSSLDSSLAVSMIRTYISSLYTKRGDAQVILQRRYTSRYFHQVLHQPM